MVLMLVSRKHHRLVLIMIIVFVPDGLWLFIRQKSVSVKSLVCVQLLVKVMKLVVWKKLRYYCIDNLIVVVYVLIVAVYQVPKSSPSERVKFKLTKVLSVLVLVLMLFAMCCRMDGRLQMVPGGAYQMVIVPKVLYLITPRY